MTIQHRFVPAILAAAAALVTAGFAHAITPADKIVVGVGTSDDSCEKWIAARAANRNDTRKVDEYLTVTWMQGYLSGANMTNIYADGKLAAALPSSDDISDWLDKACKTSPSAAVFQLADPLMQELQKRSRK